LETWLRQAFTEYPDRPVDDVHLDQLIGPWESGVREGVEWVRYSCDVLADVTRAVLSEDRFSAVQEVLVALPLASSRRLRLWSSTFWQYAGMDYQPPSLYLSKGELFGSSRRDEEYFRRIELPISDCPNVEAMYRSSRNLEVGDRQDDFVNAIFLLAHTNRDRVTR
jgi:hypothetical protein